MMPLIPRLRWSIGRPDRFADRSIGEFARARACVFVVCAFVLVCERNGAQTDAPISTYASRGRYWCDRPTAAQC
jgi:hypothetical protein